MLLFTLWIFAPAHSVNAQAQRSVSGIYPHLAMYNQHAECGTGAVVPWAGKLWAITYAPHYPNGSTDKLYEISQDLTVQTRAESIGGTPANRMIHSESNQLFIGPYAIGQDGTVRTVPNDQMPGRLTGNARHLDAPVDKIYHASMEEGFYEVDVHTLEVTTIYKDGHEEGVKVDATTEDGDQRYAAIPGAHGKGLYSGQGVLVYSNNGEATPEAKTQFDIESGALAEWDGKDWQVVRRNQFVEVTGPGGIYGNKNPETDPIWATGWDHKSIILGVRNTEAWKFYRLPKTSHSYDGAHGWNTEWPRIRNIGLENNPDYLMTMHGMFWDFPATFSVGNTAGIRPRSAYLKVIGDFTRWNDQLVFGCDDSAQKEFLNKRPQKGNIEGPGQSNSNLWFTDFDTPDLLGPMTAHGAVWLKDEVAANEYSEPFLFFGWPKRTAWIKNHGEESVRITFQIDRAGNDQWVEHKVMELNAQEGQMVSFLEEDKGEWIRAESDRSTVLSLSFNYAADDLRTSKSQLLFEGLSRIEDGKSAGGLLYGLGDDRRALGMVAMRMEDKSQEVTGYYELNQDLSLTRKDDAETTEFIQQGFAIPKDVIVQDEASILVVDAQGRRWRLPRASATFDAATTLGQLRICREVATERDLFSSHGTFYELPAENADGFAKIRPIASHDFKIHDYASCRGLLVMSGIDLAAPAGAHIIKSDDGQAALWVGAIDDLWKLGKPIGEGGPWRNTPVTEGEISDPYLIGYYDQRALMLSHDSDASVTFTMEIDPTGHGPWIKYQEFEVKAGEIIHYDFPAEFEARWVRFGVDRACKATSWLTYD